jgi:dTDP-4-amino-4,6-dideoxygalactose transaminase
VKLRHLDDWNAARRLAARLYEEWLKEVDGVVTPTAAEDRTHVYHLYVIQHPRRDALLSALRERGISAGLHYPTPVHRQPCYESLGIPRGSLPVTESLAPRIISLPMFPEITQEQVEHICQQVRRFSSAPCA